MTVPAHITLWYRQQTGIIAVASGTRFGWAHSALEAAGFSRQLDGTRLLPLADPATVPTALARLHQHAREHQVVATTSDRPFIGDLAQQITQRLPGTWSSRVEIYPNRNCQQDLSPFLWGDGELRRMLATGPVPATAPVPANAVLESDDGTQLLLFEPPERPGQYLVGAFLPSGFDESAAQALEAPRSIGVPVRPALAAHAISVRLLPRYRRALHTLGTHEVSEALCTAVREQELWQDIVETGRFTDATPLSDEGLARGEEQARDHAWDLFRSFLDHGAALLDHAESLPHQVLGPTADPGHTDHQLAQLRRAFHNGHRVLTQWQSKTAVLRETPPSLPAESYAQAARQRNGAAWLAITTWLRHGQALIDFARQTPPSHPQAAALPPSPRTAVPALPAPAAANSPHPSRR